MTNPLPARGTRSYKTLAAAIVVAAIITSATLFATLGSASKFTKTVPETVATTETSTLTPLISNTSSTKTTQTCTDIPNLGFLYCSSNPLRITEEFGDASASWNFTVSINSTWVTPNHPLLLEASLTNTDVEGSNATISEFIEPFINPEVYNTNGTILWQWNPQQTTSTDVTFPGGQTISQSLDIPTAQLQAGQAYFLKVIPLSISLPTPQSNLADTFQFSVGTAVTLSTTSTVTITSATPATSTTACSLSTTCASFTYGPTGQVQVLSVQATQQICQNCGAVNGQSYVYFQIVFENTGTSPIYVLGGFSYCEPISTTVPTNSSVLQAVVSQHAGCAGETVTIDPGQNYTVDAPNAADGVSYQLIQAGTVSVGFNFTWTTDQQATTFSNSTTISASFNFA
jgi:hypothetical protein